MPRRYSKRSSKRRSKRTAAATANKALAIAKKTQRRVELKFLDRLENTTSVLITGTTPVALSNPIQGDGSSNRDGNDIFVTSVDIRGAFLMIPTEICRMVVYSWTSGTSSVPTDVFQDTNNSTAVYTHKSWNNRFRSNILLDKVFCPKGFSGATQVEVPFHFRVKGMNHRVRMSSGGTGAENGMIYIVFMSNIGDTPPTVNWRSRVIFKDL